MESSFLILVVLIGIGFVYLIGHYNGEGDGFVKGLNFWNELHGNLVPKYTTLELYSEIDGSIHLGSCVWRENQFLFVDAKTNETIYHITHWRLISKPKK